tara:strand:- start:2688 stop:3647 length:960 start_codon:yes stop_codon:yes gene_type:complete
MSNINFNFISNIGDFTLKSNSNFSQGVNFIWGRSGNGKSTLLNNIAGFITPEEGEIIINEQIIYSSIKKINVPPNKRSISYVQQEDSLFPYMNVLDNVEFGYKFLDESQKKITPYDVIDIFEIRDLLSLYPSQLSGGQKQKVALARSLARNGQILLLDEPLNSIDFISSKKIYKAIEKLSEDLKLCVLYITHSIDEISRTNKEILYVNDGNANEKKTKDKLLRFWDDETFINEVHDGEFTEKSFSSKSVIISKESFTHNDIGFYFSGSIKSILKKSKSTLIKIESDKDYFISLDNDIFSKLELGVNDKAFCFVYKNLFL